MASSTKAPKIQEITTLPLPSYKTTTLNNGMALHTLHGGTEPVMRMEMVFRAGATYETKSGVAEVMAGQLSEGTITMNSAALAERIESLGATLFTRGGVDTVRIRLLTLTRYFPELLRIVREVMQNPAFDPDELKLYTDNKIERLQIDLKKNEVLAYRHLTEAIFGPHHPYGKNIFPDDYRMITTDDLRDHHQKFITPARGMILMSGSFGEMETDLIHEVLGTVNPVTNDNVDQIQAPIAESKTGYLEFDGPGEHQAAIRIGRKLFPQAHPDFNGLYVLNTILGGYFGSRLMTEIRENQGLTYGIYSSVDSFAEDGCFYISTEAATVNTGRVLDAIAQEISRLQQELIPDDELRMARNYLMGHLMTQVDGPFSSLDFIKALKIERLPDSSFVDLINTIQGITPGTLRELAAEYLKPSDWVTVVVK